MFLLYLALTAVTAAALVLLLGRSGRGASLPPGPKPLPVIGNLHQLAKKSRWLQFHHWAKDYGDVMYLNLAGQHFVILSSHEAAFALLSKRGNKYSDRPRSVMAGELVTRGMHMLLRPYNDRYRLHQRLQAPLLNPRSAATYRPLQELEAQKTLFSLLREADSSGPRGVDYHHQVERAMASLIYSLEYGFRLQTGHEQPLQDGKKVQAEFARTGEVGAYLVDSMPALNHLPAFLAPWKREGEELYQLERNLHEGNLQTGLDKPGWNFTKAMTGNPEAKGVSRTELAFSLGIVADAGLDTSTVALHWFAVAWLCGDGRWVRKAQALLDEVVGTGRMPTFEDRPKLPYIDAIVHETLRWRPVVVQGVPHFTKAEDQYGPYRIPAGSIVLPNAFAITRDEAAFGPDTDAFIPERWMADVPEGVEHKIDAGGRDTTVVKDLPQTGFGFGRRICTGRHIATSQLFIQMARLLWAFDFEAAVDPATGKPYELDPMDISEGFVACPRPFRVVIRPRGQWARDLIVAGGDTDSFDYFSVLDEAAEKLHV